MTDRWWCEYAWVEGAAQSGVLIESDAGMITSVSPGHTVLPQGAATLRGLVIPGMANAHSHAFHRALRGHTQRGTGSFWTWREQMYAVAGRLDPDTYLALARATYAEMALAGITAVGEFHYVHHQPGGVPYDSPNVMSDALVTAAADAGIRITLLDTCYLAGGFGKPLNGAQQRFGDGDADAWAVRASARSAAPHAIAGAAAHSVRAVPADQLGIVAEWSARADSPLHFHLSEQVAENDGCLAMYGATPTEVLANAGALSPRSTAVHATHLTDGDLALLGGTRTGSCFCPTTERDLADGIGPARRLIEAGSPLSLGSDSHAVIDMFEEARAVELNARLAEQTRGHLTAAALLDAATVTGHRAIGWDDAGRIAVGQRADLVAIDIASRRTAGFTPAIAPETAVFAATSTDITDVIIDGQVIVKDRRHTRVPDVGAALTSAIKDLS